MKIGVVIPAAGRGTRMKTNINKQYLKILTKPIIVHTLELFDRDSRFEEIILVVRDTEVSYCREEILEKYNFNNIKIVAGGETRRESVFAGLMAFSPAIDYVIIHDGARPLLPYDVIDRVITNLTNFDALTAAVHVKDTIKIKDEDNFVKETLDRGKLAAIQTPQAFSCDLIKKAHQEISKAVKVSDDASLVEKMGKSVKIIRGSFQNIKITTPDDLTYARIVLQNRS